MIQKQVERENIIELFEAGGFQVQQAAAGDPNYWNLVVPICLPAPADHNEMAVRMLKALPAIRPLVAQLQLLLEGGDRGELPAPAGSGGGDQGDGRAAVGSRVIEINHEDDHTFVGLR